MTAEDPAQGLAEGVVAALAERGQTVATAESVTAGGVCVMLTTVPGSSAVVRGGLVVYATDLKTSLAGVDEKVLAEHGAVYPEVAVQLAAGARARCGSDWGLGLTGVAGPGSAEGVACGTVFIGLVGPRVRTVRALHSDRDRAGVRAAAVAGALQLLREHLC
ncbi:MAG: CinA family protein [Haloechinothrix sp.]